MDVTKMRTMVPHSRERILGPPRRPLHGKVRGKGLRRYLPTLERGRSFSRQRHLDFGKRKKWTTR